ncbi:MAG: EAL domain-containing protein [Bacteroidota bacterium]
MNVVRRGRLSVARMRVLRSAIALGRCAALMLVLAAIVAFGRPAHALTPVTVAPEQDRIDITEIGDLYEARGDNLQVETAPATDGSTGRMSVRAVTPGTSPNWLVFALRNSTDKPIERWLVAERYNAVGSGIIWPDLDARRIETVTPSVGFLPDRVKSDRADIFRVTIEPGQTITYVAELASDRLARIHLWKALEYEQKSRDRQLFNGIMLGITGLLAVFLTAVFAANHRLIFPTAALVSWCVLALLCVDFGFWHKLFQMRPEDNAQYRAAAEAAVAASLVLFLFTFLRVNLWHGFVRMLFAVWIVGQLAIVAAAILDPRLAATVARMSMAGIGIIGAVLTLFLALRGLDRALALLPTWILFLVWLFGAAVTLTGRLTGEIPVVGLLAGLVLIIVLLGFTVTQFAFRSVEPLYGASPNELQLRSAAIDSAGVAVWEWFARRNEIKVDPVLEATLGLNPGLLSAKVDDFASYLHPADKERFQLMLQSVRDQAGGPLRLTFRMRHADSSYRWFELEGASVLGSDRRALRCIGLMRDVTDERRAQERMMHDAVHDSLTGLPNRELLLDRLGVALVRAKTDPEVRPTLIYCDLDKFKSVNGSFGLVVGDSLLLTVARRLARSLPPHDTLARVGGDQFALVLTANQDPRELARFAERVRQSLRSPIRIAGQEIVLTGSIGLAIYDGSQASAQDLLQEAELAMQRAKRSGSDRIEIFKPEMRADKNHRLTMESELRHAIDGRQLVLLYQPIVALSTEELVGFEAITRWHHPRLGLIDPSEFIPAGEGSDLVAKLGSHILARAAADLARWQKELPRPNEPLFMSVNVSSRRLVTPDLVQEVRHVLGRSVVPRGSLRLELTESLVMENPEQASHILDLLKDAGAALALDEFGTGYSSLAYLQRFPFDVVKIDHSLVQSSQAEGNGAAIVRSLVALSHELGKKVVAEGVESTEDAALLRSIGCEMAQGLYYGEPVGERDVLHLLRLIRKADRRMRRRGVVRGQPKRKVAEAPTHAEPVLRGGDAKPGLQSVPAPAFANGQDRTVRTGPPSRPAARTGPPTQPVTRPPAAASPQQSRVRSAAANARARIAGLAKSSMWAAPEPANAEPLLKTLPPTPLRPTDSSPGNGAGGAAQRPHAAGRPPPLPHQMPRPDRTTTAPARAPTRVASAGAKPANLDVLPPEIKASLEKLAGGLERPRPTTTPDTAESNTAGTRKRSAN